MPIVSETTADAPCTELAQVAHACSVLTDTNASLVALTARQAEKIERLTDSVMQQAQEIEQLKAELQRLRSQGTPATSASPPAANLVTLPTTAEPREASVSIVRQCVEVMKELAEKEQKAHNLVILGSPEGPTPEETNLMDRAIVGKVMARCGVPNDNLIEVFRHGLQRGGRPRPIKIKFRNTRPPQAILHTLRQTKSYSAVLPSHSRIRRDLTLTEQIAERDARAEAYRKNVEAGQYAWRVADDFSVVAVAQPGPWTAKKAPRTPTTM